VIAKLQWAKQGGSERQIQDVTGILKILGKQLDFAYINFWVHELNLQDVWQAAGQE